MLFKLIVKSSVFPAFTGYWEDDSPEEALEVAREIFPSEEGYSVSLVESEG